MINELGYDPLFGSEQWQRAADDEPARPVGLPLYSNGQVVPIVKYLLMELPLLRGV